MFWSGSKRPLPVFLLPGKTINVLFETRDCGGETRGKGGIRKELAGQTYRKKLKFLGKNASNSRFVRSTWFLRCSLRGTSRRHLENSSTDSFFQPLYRRVPGLCIIRESTQSPLFFPPRACHPAGNRPLYAFHSHIRCCVYATPLL